VTGLSNNDAGLAAKRLELLKEALPRLTRAAVLKNPANPSAEAQFAETNSAARVLALEIQPVDVRDPKEVETAFATMIKGGAGRFTVLGDPVFRSQQKRVADLALRKRLPSIFPRSENVEVGGLMSYGASLADMYRQAAVYVDKILKGAKPGDLPVEEPTRMYLVINHRTAKALGLTIPPGLLRRADQVIE
jgi:putative ABC transport system substrate-binding protein